MATGSVIFGGQRGGGKMAAAREAEILTMAEACRYLRVGRKLLRNLAAAGQVPAFRVHVQWRFRRRDLDRWIEERVNGPRERRA